jgi:hypothetical protein
MFDKWLMFDINLQLLLGIDEVGGVVTVSCQCHALLLLKVLNMNMINTVIQTAH